MTDPSDQSHSETEGDSKSAKTVKKPTIKKPSTKGTPSSLQGKKRKPEIAADATAKEDNQKKKKAKLDDLTASPSKKAEPAKKKAATTSESAKEDHLKGDDVSAMPNGETSVKTVHALESEKDGRPTSHAGGGIDTTAPNSVQGSPAVESKPKKVANNRPMELIPLDPAVETLMQKLRQDAAKGKRQRHNNIALCTRSVFAYSCLSNLNRGLCCQIKVSS